MSELLFWTGSALAVCGFVTRVALKVRLREPLGPVDIAQFVNLAISGFSIASGIEAIAIFIPTRGTMHHAMLAGGVALIVAGAVAGYYALPKRDP